MSFRDGAQILKAGSNDKLIARSEGSGKSVHRVFVFFLVLRSFIFLFLQSSQLGRELVSRLFFS